jgi:hypothetical protein
VQPLQQTAPSPEGDTCGVCGDPIRYVDRISQSGDLAVCAARACRRVASRRERLAPAIFAHELDAQRRMIRQERARKAEEKQRVAEIARRQESQNAELLQQASLERPELAARQTGLVSIPSGLSALTPLSAERRERYRQQLEALVEAVRAPEDRETDDADEQHAEIAEKTGRVEGLLDAHPGLRSLSDRVCALCRGGCCREGADSAYLSRHTLRRVLAAHPEWGPGALVDAYLSRLAPETVAGACINQGAEGCVLPRELRSETCNGYYCETLEEFQERAADRGEPGVALAVRRSHPHWRRLDPAACHDVVEVAWVGSDLLVAVGVRPRPEAPA